jgi:hypothetical protein
MTEDLLCWHRDLRLPQVDDLTSASNRLQDATGGHRVSWELGHPYAGRRYARPTCSKPLDPRGRRGTLGLGHEHVASVGLDEPAVGCPDPSKDAGQIELDVQVDAHEDEAPTVTPAPFELTA